MALINREGDISEKKEWFSWDNGFGLGVSNLVQTGQTLVITGPIPYPGTIQSGSIFATGVSTAMQLSLRLQRFVPGSGMTLITVGISNVACANASVSGPIGFSGFPAAGSTLLNFLAGDVFMIVTSVTNGAASTLDIQLVVIKTQDIVSYNGIGN